MRHRYFLHLLDLPTFHTRARGTAAGCAVIRILPAGAFRAADRSAGSGFGIEIIAQSTPSRVSRQRPRPGLDRHPWQPSELSGGRPYHHESPDSLPHYQYCIGRRAYFVLLLGMHFPFIQFLAGTAAIPANGQALLQFPRRNIHLGRSHSLSHQGSAAAGLLVKAYPGGHMPLPSLSENSSIGRLPGGQLLPIPSTVATANPSGPVFGTGSPGPLGQTEGPLSSVHQAVDQGH